MDDGSGYNPEVPSLPKLAVLVGDRSRGSNMAALVRATHCGELALAPALVVAGRASSPALAHAAQLKVPGAVVQPGDDYAARLVATLEAADIEWIALAGYLRRLPEPVLHRWPQRVLNVHPALLPRFGGNGMYGAHVHRAVLATGERESGCTVHYVSEHYDEGRVLVQLRCPVRPADDADMLAARVLRLEHVAFALGFRLALMEHAE